MKYELYINKKKEFIFQNNIEIFCYQKLIFLIKFQRVNYLMLIYIYYHDSTHMLHKFNHIDQFPRTYFCC